MRTMLRKTSLLDATANHGTMHACRDGIMSTTIKTNEGRVSIARFNTESLAIEVAIRDRKSIVFGDDGEFWLVRRQDVGVMRRAGYEVMS
jgi:hypothetical protein